MSRAVILALLTCTGCTNVSRCKTDTLFVGVTLDGNAATADTLDVAVTLGSAAPITTPIRHQSGAVSGSVEIDFPSGYPIGKSITISVTAMKSGVALGADSVTTTLTSGCGNASLTVTATSSVTHALAGADLTGAPPPDLSGADLLGAPPQDLSGCMPQTENCFDGIDNDCDGLVDCADPDCSGGANPIATCVPVPGSFTLGVTVATPGNCPSTWATATTIDANISSTCNGGSCGGCALINDDGTGDVCNILISDATTDSTCGSYTGNRVPTTGGCTAFTAVPSGDYHSVVPPYYDGYCSGASGTASKVTPTWSASELFCSGGATGGGCGAGKTCVPSAPNHCVMTAGSQVTCPANYVLHTTRYYTGFDDSGRSCSCACSSTGTGTCSAGTASVQVFSGTCLAGVALANGCQNDDISSYNHAEATGISITSHVSCSPTTKQTGSTTLLGEQTVCCTQ